MIWEVRRFGFFFVSLFQSFNLPHLLLWPRLFSQRLFNLMFTRYLSWIYLSLRRFSLTFVWLLGIFYILYLFFFFFFAKLVFSTNKQRWLFVWSFVLKLVRVDGFDCFVFSFMYTLKIMSFNSLVRVEVTPFIQFVDCILLQRV